MLYRRQVNLGDRMNKTLYEIALEWMIKILIIDEETGARGVQTPLLIFCRKDGKAIQTVPLRSPEDIPKVMMIRDTIRPAIIIFFGSAAFLAGKPGSLEKLTKEELLERAVEEQSFAYVVRASTPTAKRTIWLPMSGERRGQLECQEFRKGFKDQFHGLPGLDDFWKGYTN